MKATRVIIQNMQSAVRVPSGLRLLVRRCCSAVLSTEGKTLPQAEVGVSFVDNAEIRRLNAEYRDKNEVTDVLSFPLHEEGKAYDKNPDTGAILLGDIVISLERAVRQAANYGHSLQREVGFLTVHAMLHLLGYDHEGSPLETLRMREREEECLQSLGLAREGSEH